MPISVHTAIMIFIHAYNYSSNMHENINTHYLYNMHQVYIPICKTVFFTERAPKVLPIPQLFSVVIVDLIPATCNIFMHACTCEIREE